MFTLLYIIFVSRWAGGKEDKYFSRIGKNSINVYETNTMTLLDKKSLKVDNVMDFIWSPTDPILSMFMLDEGGGNQPAKVSIIFTTITLSHMVLGSNSSSGTIKFDLNSNLLVLLG